MRFVPLAALLLALVPAAQAPAKPPIRLGAVFSTTGAAAAYGAQQAEGARFAVAEINRSGGVLHRRLVLDVRDDGSDAAAATTAFGALIDGGAVALLGPTLSNSALQADQVAQQRRIPVMAVSNTGDGVLDIGDYIFRDSLAERVVQPKTIAATKQKLGYTSAAIVWATPDAYSKTGHDVFAQALAGQGVTLTADAAFVSADPEAYRAAVDTAAAARPQALIISALAPDVAKVMQYARTLPALATVPFIGGNAFNTPGLAARANGTAEGAISGAAWIATRRAPGNARFVRDFTEIFGEQPDQFAAQAYTGVKLLATAMRRERSAKPARIRRGLARLRNVPTVLGRFSFDSGREPLYDPVIVKIAGDGYVRF